MDKVFTYLSDRPDGASAEEIAREALGLTGAVGLVADQVVRAAAEADGRISGTQNGHWSIRREPARKLLRETTYAVCDVHEEADGSLTLAATRVGFRIRNETQIWQIPVERSESALRIVDGVEAFLSGTVCAGYRLSTIRNCVNAVSRFHAGREIVPQGLCISRMATRSFPNRKVRSRADVADALSLPCLEGDYLDQRTVTVAGFLMGLLEWCEARGHHTVESVVEFLKPTVTSVDFESFAFDEAYLDEIPSVPGVYVMRDVGGNVIYVGKSVHLRDRVKTYFSKRSEREEKTLRILERIWTVEVEEVGSELEALILEARLIQATRPEFNKQQRVHEGTEPIDRDPCLLVLPSADAGSVELYCVREDRDLIQVRVRKDLADWRYAWTKVEAYFDGDAEELEKPGIASRRILKRWLRQKENSVNVIDLGNAGERDNFKRLVEEHVQAADNEAWEKVWRV
ncbi:MAG TPA: hypothetical protein DHW45_03870 [Candidatus Latescibacteria bacterium]|nr:hypothetical protein [Candidatus Latescibacterota bacterium]